MTAPAGRTVGRYTLLGKIASGGMASVHFARLVGAAGFSRIVAIKRLHPYLAEDPDLADMFVAEARLASRIRHPNVVAMIDVVAEDGELFLVLDYVHGETLARLARSERARGARIDERIATAVVCGALHGLHAAHEARSERGDPLDIVHRDVSPENVIVGADGVARVADFGIAKAREHVQTTTAGKIKGKVAYMAPEQLLRQPTDRRADVFAAGVVLWEAITGRRLFKGENDVDTAERVLRLPIPAPGLIAAGLDSRLGEVVMKALDRDPVNRFPTARAMALALERSVPGGVATAFEVAEWVGDVAGPALLAREKYELEVDALPADEPDTASLELTDRLTPSVREAACLPDPTARAVVLPDPQRSGAAAWRAATATSAGAALLLGALAGAVLVVPRSEASWRGARTGGGVSAPMPAMGGGASATVPPAAPAASTASVDLVPMKAPRVSPPAPSGAVATPVPSAGRRTSERREVKVVPNYGF